MDNTLRLLKNLTGMGSALLLISLGCQQHDVCEGVAGSCLGLSVEGDSSFDTLRTTLYIPGASDPQPIGITTAGPSGLTVPLTLVVFPPLNVNTSQVTAVAVAGLRGGIEQAAARSNASFTWPDNSHVNLTLQLSSKDGGADDMNPAPNLTWRTESSGTRGTLYGVWSGASSQGFAVGDNGLSLTRQTDGTWSADSPGITQTLNGIFGIAGSSVWRVGQNLGAWRRDNTTWGQDSAGLNLGTGGELLGVAVGAMPGELWAGDRSGRVWHRTGSAMANGTWQTPEQVFAQGFRVMGVASAGGAVFAVGDSGSVAVRKDSEPGTAWTIFKYPSTRTGEPFTINSVCAFDKDTAIAVGTGGLLVRYSGGTWLQTPASVATQDSQLLGVWGQRPERVWAVGGHGVIIRVEGSRVTELAKNFPQSLFGVFGLSEADIYAVGSTMGASLILHGTP